MTQGTLDASHQNPDERPGSHPRTESVPPLTPTKCHITVEPSGVHAGRSYCTTHGQKFDFGRCPGEQGRRRARVRYRGWFGRTARRRCPHSEPVPIFGDRINDVGGWRLWCLGCRRHIDGPVVLAETRAAELAQVA